MELLCGHDSILLMTTLEVTSEIYSSKFLLGREAKKEHRSSLVRHCAQRWYQNFEKGAPESTPEIECSKIVSGLPGQ
jgi:hypothetical protein